MPKSILTTIDIVAQSFRIGCAEEMMRWCLLNDGWTLKRANQIILWAKRMPAKQVVGEIIDSVGETVEER